MRASSSTRNRELPRTRADRLRAERTLGRAGLLASLSPLAVPALQQLHAAATGGVAELVAGVLTPLAGVVAALLLAGGLALARAPSWGRALIIAGGLGFGALGTAGLETHPARAMVLLIGTVVFCSWVYFAPEAGEPGHTMRNSRLARGRMAALGSACAVFLAVAFRMTADPWVLGHLFASQLIALGLAARGIPRARPRDLASLAVSLAAGGAAAALWREPELAAFTLLAAPIALLLVLRHHVERDPLRVGDGIYGLLLEQPSRLLVGTFMLAGVAGAVTLTLPASSTSAPVGLLDAAFTAFSAVCVTGLAVLDTGVDYSRAGQAVILVLIQLGGLGIMSFSTAALVLLGWRPTLRQERAMLDLLESDHRADLVTALRRMLIITGVSEAVGAAILTVSFYVHGDSWATAAWRGVFTSVSAYCNAGFALQGDSLVGYQHEPVILHCVGVLVILGGLGPAIVAALPQLVRRRRLALHVRIVLLSTAALLIVPAALLAALEWNHSLAALPVPARLHNAWFQSLTTRTAGFNSVDFAAMTPASQTLVEALMFVGGSPGSTAGGIKTTTAFVMLIAVLSVARGSTTVTWGGWTIARTTVYRAAAVMSLGAASVVFGVFLIQLTQAMSTRTAIFEVVSALGTVGLSIGGTAALDSVGKLIIIAFMFLGRVAPLTLFLIFSRADDRGERWGFPEQDLSVG